jgi:hypothetical protein
MKHKKEVKSMLKKPYKSPIMSVHGDIVHITQDPGKAKPTNTCDGKSGSSGNHGSGNGCIS